MVTAKKILYGGPDAQPLDPEVKSIGELALKKFGEYYRETLLTDGITGVKLSALDLRMLIIQCAKALQLQFDIKEGDVVGICCENSLEFVVVTFATLCLGATAAPFDVSYTTHEIQHALDLSQPKVLFISSLVCDKILKILPEQRYLEMVVTLDEPKHPEGSPKMCLFNDLLQKIPIDNCGNFECPSIDASTIAFILFSSGTTGPAKAVELTQSNILAAIYQSNSTLKMLRPVIGKGIILMVLPLFHAYGLLTTLSSVVNGAETVVLRTFEARSFLDAIQTYQVNFGAVVPSLATFLAEHPLVDEYDVTSLMIMTCGAAPLRKEIYKALLNRLKNILFFAQSYNMTEMTLTVLTQTPLRMKLGSVGILRPGVWGKVVDIETGDTLGPHERGEMCFKGSTVMNGYRRNLENTRQIIDADGWLHTGDIGYYDGEQEWFIVDRMNELINYKGFQLAPVDIEAILMAHPDVVDTAVIGIPDESFGGVPLAFVVRKADSNLIETDVWDFVADTISTIYRLHGSACFIDEIPRNVVGKILRRVLREQILKKCE